MYKIYINDTPLILTSSNDLSQLEYNPTESLVTPYSGKYQNLLNYVDLLEKTKRYQQVIIHAHNLETLLEDFKKNFQIIEAAGGIVFNPNHQVLSIFRRGFWDLPKGKIEKGEEPTEAAIREVQEETGIRTLEIAGPLIMGYHTYRIDKKRILKPTYWFVMKTPGTSELIPQIEEDIEQVIWRSLEDLRQEKLIYRNLLEVLSKV
jgi:8-oxo-dGTP pyrophosphatase MutT (NUDIX family)